ncbi:MAG TPA: hypothetical protein VM406_15305 [Noviherbaspirillum sp.]|nr:hypothetical protein [Noviherbaspirillum sp.]
MRSAFKLLPVAFVAALLLPLPALADYAGLKQINDIIRGAPGVSTVATGAGVSATASGVHTASTNGLKIPVPTSATAHIPKASVATAARAAVRLMGPIGTAATAYNIYRELQDSGLHTCPPPDFFCKQVPEQVNPRPAHHRLYFEVTPGKNYAQEIDACWDSKTVQYDNNPNGDARVKTATSVKVGAETTYQGNVVKPCQTVGGTQPNYVYNYVRFHQWLSCPSGYTLNTATNMCVSNTTVTRPFSDPEFDQELLDRINANPERAKRYYDAIQNDLDRTWYPLPREALVPTNTPVDVSAPPVSTPQRTVQTETITKPDGTTETRTKTEQTTVTPQRTGTTTGNTQVTYPSSTTQITTIVNNTTNETTTHTTVINHPAESPSELEIPEDYAREGTLGEVLEAIRADGAPDMEDQRPLVDSAVAKHQGDLDKLYGDLPSGMAEDKDRFFSWVWSPEIGVCSPFGGVVAGHEIVWDLCPTIEMIRDALGWLFALFSAWTVYGQMFKRYD